MTFIAELKATKGLIIDSENLRAVDGVSLDTISYRIRNNHEFQVELREAENKLYRSQSSCANRI